MHNKCLAFQEKLLLFGTIESSARSTFIKLKKVVQIIIQHIEKVICIFIIWQNQEPVFFIGGFFHCSMRANDTYYSW